MREHFEKEFFIQTQKIFKNEISDFLEYHLPRPPPVALAIALNTRIHQLEDDFGERGIGFLGLSTIGGDEATGVSRSGMPIGAIVGSVVIIPKSDAATGIESGGDVDGSALVPNGVSALGSTFMPAHSPYSSGNNSPHSRLMGLNVPPDSLFFAHFTRLFGASGR